MRGKSFQLFQKDGKYIANLETKEISLEAFLFNSKKTISSIQYCTRGTSLFNKMRAKKKNSNYQKGREHFFFQVIQFIYAHNGMKCSIWKSQIIN